MPDVAYHRPFVFAHPRLPPVCGEYNCNQLSAFPHGLPFLCPPCMWRFPSVLFSPLEGCPLRRKHRFLTALHSVPF